MYHTKGLSECLGLAAVNDDLLSVVSNNRVSSGNIGGFSSPVGPMKQEFITYLKNGLVERDFGELF